MDAEENVRVLRLDTAGADAGRTVKSVLRERLGLADSLLSHLKFEENAVLCNGKPVRMCEKLLGGEEIRVRLREGRAKNVRAVPLEMDIRYEDEDILILNKPEFPAVHGAPQQKTPTLQNALAAYWGEDRPFHPVNRLDKGTSGLMLIAKSRYVHDRLRMMLHTPDFRREYLAIVDDEISPPSGVIELPILREEGTNRRSVGEGGKPARTIYETIAVSHGHALLRVQLDTGRTHQIRVHFSALGHPLTGDVLYGSTGTEFGRPALHSCRIDLCHPVSGEKISVCAPLPEDMERLRKKIWQDTLY